MMDNEGDVSATVAAAIVAAAAASAACKITDQCHSAVLLWPVLHAVGSRYREGFV